jgi:cell fate regulator YaaT (PSP1 superfamily)
MTEEPDAAQTVVGVRFKEAGRVFYFDAGGLSLEVGQRVVVQTPQGSEMARVVIAPDQVLASEINEPLNPVLRIAETSDLEQADSLKETVRGDLEVARKKVEEHDLPMRLVGGDFNLEGSQLTIYFTAEQRVDFRNLVRDLASSLNKRVQLLQVGDRDRAKLMGGIGHCGYQLCCRSWLTNFPSISIRMAKEQDVPLNPAKISGVCGRLLCCLAFEHELYREVRGQLPKIGQFVSTPAGNAKLIGINVPKESVSLQMVEGLTIVEMAIEELRGQYGTAIRPAEVEEEAAAPVPEIKAEAAPTTQRPSEHREVPKGGGSRPRRRRRRRNGQGRPNAGPPSGQ